MALLVTDVALQLQNRPKHLAIKRLQHLALLTLIPQAWTLLRRRDGWRGEVDVGGFSSHVACDRQTEDCHTLGQRVNRASFGVGTSAGVGSPRMSAAICLLFLEGMSFTVSSAVRPFWSRMFTSTPAGRQARKCWGRRGGGGRCRQQEVKAALTCGEKPLHHVRLPEESGLVEGTAFLRLSREGNKRRYRHCLTHR